MKSVWLEEHTCYVNLSSALLSGLEESTVQASLQALGRSLCSLDGVEEVRFLIDGEFSRNLEPVDGLVATE